MPHFNSIRSVKYFDCYSMIFGNYTGDTLIKSFKACIFVFQTMWRNKYSLDDVKSLKTSNKLQAEYESFSQTFIDNQVLLEQFRCVDNLTKDLKSDIVKAAYFLKSNIILFVEVNR